MRRPAQQTLRFRSHGGRREGSGRKRTGRVSHAARERFAKPVPLHVTLRTRRGVWNLRSQRCYRRIEACFAAARGRFGIRLVHFSVLGNHLHLIVEADSSEALARGIQGLTIRVARALNELMRSRGAIFADHYHARALRTPAELANAIHYVLHTTSTTIGRAGPTPSARLRSREAADWRFSPFLKAGFFAKGGDEAVARSRTVEGR